MADEEKRIWGIHTKDDNMFLQKSVIAIGWKDMGDLSKIEASREAFKEHYMQVYPDAKKAVLPMVQVCYTVLPMRFRSEIMWYIRPRLTG